MQSKSTSVQSFCADQFILIIFEKNCVMLFPILIFILFFGFVVLVFWQKSDSIKKLNRQLLESKVIITKELKDIRCFCFATGKRNHDFRFNKTDVYILEDALFIFGYSEFQNLKWYKCLVILTHREDIYKEQFPTAQIPKLYKLNLHSFNQDVFIEFQTTPGIYSNIEIRLENLSLEDKQLIKI